MRSALILLAALAGSSLALPTDAAVDRRTPGLVGDVLGGVDKIVGGVGASVGVNVGGILGAALKLDAHARVALFAGLEAHGAAALEGVAIGCHASVIGAEARLQLKTWLELETQTIITGVLKTELIAWCESHGDLALKADLLAQLAVFIPDCAGIAAKENLYVTIDGIFASADLEGSLVLKANLQASLNAFIHGAAGLALNVKAGLSACATGGVVAGLTANVKADLLAWVSGGDCTLKADLKAAVLAWIHADVSLEASGALSVQAQASVKAFLGLQANAHIDAKIRTGLELCADGKLAAALDVAVRAKITAWLSTPECTLEAGLKATVSAWIHVDAKVDAHVGLSALGSIPASGLTAISVGASVGAAVEEKGALSVSAQASIQAFLDAKLLGDVDAKIHTGLSACAKGDLAASVNVDVRTKLAIWLSGSDCTLGAQLKATVLLWLSVGAKADVSVGLVGGLRGNINGFLSADVIASLSVNLRVALGLLVGGESLVALSWDSRAELAALLSGCTTIDIKTVHIIITQWFTGCKVPGAPAPIPLPTGTVPSGPKVTVAVPTGAKTTPAVPAGPKPTSSDTSSDEDSTGSAPSGPVETGTTGATKSVSVPSGPAPTAAGGSGVQTVTVTHTATVCNCTTK